MSVPFVPANTPNLVPYIIVRDAAKAIEFYQAVFGAVELGRVTMPDGSIGHCELSIGAAHISVSEENETWKSYSPTKLGGTPVGLTLYVPNVDEIYALATEQGATTIDPVKDQFHGDRSCTVVDPFGHKWHVMTHIEDVSFPEMQKRCDAMFAKK